MESETFQTAIIGCTSRLLGQPLSSPFEIEPLLLCPQSPGDSVAVHVQQSQLLFILYVRSEGEKYI